MNKLSEVVTTGIRAALYTVAFIGGMLAIAVLFTGCGKDYHTHITQVTEAPQVAAPNPNDIVDVIDPCGDAPGIVDEVLLRLQDGRLLASFSDNSSGKNTRFALIGPGTYQTTDGSACVFVVDAQGNVN